MSGRDAFSNVGNGGSAAFSSSGGRREVAARLRYVASDSLDGESLQRALARVTVSGDASWRGVMRRLADLIDPTCEFVPIGDDRFGCSECGVTVRLDLDAPTFDDMAMPFRHCPSCGARVVRCDE